MPLARAISPSTAAMTDGSPSLSAAFKYAVMSASLRRCLAGSQRRVLVLGTRFLLQSAHQFFGFHDVLRLGALVASRKQNDDRGAAPREIDPVTGSVIDPQF